MGSTRRGYLAPRTCPVVAAPDHDSETRQGRETITVFGEPASPPDAATPPYASRLEAWLATGGRSRVDVSASDGTLERRAVRDGPRWWSWYSDFGARSDEDDLSVGGADPVDELGPVLRGWSVAGLLRFSATSEDEVAGRRVLTASAQVREDLADGDDWPLHRLSFGVEELDLAVDPENGLLLRAKARRRGGVLQRWVVEHFTFGPISANDLAFVAPDGAPVRSVGEEQRIAWLPLHEVGAGSPFPV